MKLTKTTKVTKAIILTGVLALGALSGCSPKEEVQAKTETTVKAQTKDELVVHGADIVKTDLVNFLQMDSEEGLIFAKKNISEKLELTEGGTFNREAQEITLESDYKGLKISALYDSGKIDNVVFMGAHMAGSFELSSDEAKSMLSGYGVSPKWEKNEDKESEVATKEMRGIHYFTSEIKGKPVYITTQTRLQENKERVSTIHVSLNNN
ncbi:hypothetical protein bcgnr5372_38810 [Bacillus luti]|nr:hypothetical protein [Bacillus cereus]HDR8330714.1 hypothetical protein [Bacillus cereus]HDR8336451.1 hypothetical protein [Bacillus cereus]